MIRPSRATRLHRWRIWWLTMATFRCGQQFGTCHQRHCMRGGANGQLANAGFAAWFGVSTELVVSLGHGTHMAPATLASRSCAGWQGSSPRAAPSGTSSAGVGRNHGAGARFPPVPCRTPAAPPPARSNRSASRSADRQPAGTSAPPAAMARDCMAQRLAPPQSTAKPLMMRVITAL
jgi:hypothetical protein